MSDSALFKQVAEIVDTGDWELGARHGGTGGVGKLLEDLLDVDGSNTDIPDTGSWELKTHTGRNNLLTLFHKTGQPNMSVILSSPYAYHPKSDPTKPLSYRNTIYGNTPNSHGFYAEPSHSNTKITLFNINDSTPTDYCAWDTNELCSAFGRKLSRLILVTAHKKGSMVTFTDAWAYNNPRLLSLPKLITEGTIAIDLDARYKTLEGTGIRDHGTKFRISIKDLPSLYNNCVRIAP
ncbi:MAG: MvaI/BcnI family restriction endonuclease [bacterium]|nr:MvaI/BcnI family restriction endonuclease [bacterium]